MAKKTFSQGSAPDVSTCSQSEAGDGRVDLHIHSSLSSDGDFSPSEIILMAKDKALRAISISDHDTVAAYPEALEFSRGVGVELIPSVELTTLFDGREFHLLLPFVDWKSAALGEILRQQAVSRVEEAKGRLGKLRELGFDLTWEEVAEASHGIPPLGVTIAQVLVRKGEKLGDLRLKKYYEGQNRLIAPYVFYKDYFMEGKPAFVPKRHVRLLDVLALVPASGGVPVLAHPGAYFQMTTREDLTLLREKGLAGVEVYSSYHKPEQVELYKALAEKLDLVSTAGSDFHGQIKPHITLGDLREGCYRMVEELQSRRGNNELELG